jgi:acyl carrier protein
LKDRTTMARERPIRRLVAEQIGGRNGVDLIAIAHALEEDFGVTLPREQLARLSSYGELLQLLRDVLAGSTDGMSDEELASCVVRARVVAGGSDGRVAMVRVGWLTPELATAIADDVRNAPTGTWLDFLVPDDLTDGEVTNLRQWLRAMISQQVRVNVRRTSERAAS